MEIARNTWFRSSIVVEDKLRGDDKSETIIKSNFYNHYFSSSKGARACEPPLLEEK